ncbi:MAG: hypothetical protein JJT88_00140 [Gammaproteobacteria bacterium]|nr:hypothetical protein [Gammaproteobacteria bacterium]
MSKDPPDAADHETWSAKLFRADHWLCLEAAMAAEKFARLLEERTETQGNAAIVWLQASELYGAYTRAWEGAGAAARWDHDFRREGEQAAQRAAALRGGEYSFLDPPWLNHVVGGQAEEALAEALAEIDAAFPPSDLTRAARRVLAHYCRAAGERQAGEDLFTSISPPDATGSR